MAHMQGGKITKSHSTLSEVSNEVVNFLNKIPEVTKISIGIIINTGGSANSIWSVKIIDEISCVLIRTTQKSINQQIRFYTKTLEDKQIAKNSLADWVEKRGWQVRFQK